MKIVFLGTPEFALSSLCAVFEAGYEVVAVVSQPDREKDKKGNLIFTPVKVKAMELGLKVFQYEKISRDGIAELAELEPDVFITAAYGQLLSEGILSIPKFGTLNVHASILPKYRGSSPIQAAIAAGENETGVTIMRTEKGLDTGDILALEKVKIEPDDTSMTLSGKLAKVGANLLVRALGDLENCLKNAKKQDNEKATYCKKIVKTDALIDWNNSAADICNLVRAYNPAPVAFTVINDKILKIYEVKAEYGYTAEPGKALIANAKNGLIIACKDGAISVKTIQAQGKKVMNILDFMRGFNIDEGVKL